METMHRQEFESFMLAWDDAIRGFQEVSTNQMDTMVARHQREI
jgi:hypothetical protein